MRYLSLSRSTESSAGSLSLSALACSFGAALDGVGFGGLILFRFRDFGLRRQTEGGTRLVGLLADLFHLGVGDSQILVSQVVFLCARGAGSILEILHTYEVAQSARPARLGRIEVLDIAAQLLDLPVHTFDSVLEFVAIASSQTDLAAHAGGARGLREVALGVVKRSGFLIDQVLIRLRVELDDLLPLVNAVVVLDSYPDDLAGDAPRRRRSDSR